MKLDWLADAFRAADLDVREYDGWKTRTNEPFDSYTPVGLIDHHTAAPVPYPISKLLTKCNYTITPEGVVWVLNAGWAADSGYGDRKVLEAVRTDSPRPAPSDTYKSLSPVTPGGTNPGILGNRWFIDVEVQHVGDGSPLPAAARRALIVTNAVVCGRMDWNPATRLIGHREWSRRKIDPRWDGTSNPMSGIRTDTIEAMEGEDMALTVAEIWGALFGSGSNRKSAAQLLAEAARDAAVARRLAEVQASTGRTLSQADIDAIVAEQAESFGLIERD